MSDVPIKQEPSPDFQSVSTIPPQSGSNSSAIIWGKARRRKQITSPASSTSLTNSSTAQFPGVDSSPQDVDMHRGAFPTNANARGSRALRNYRAVGRGAARANRTRARGGHARGGGLCAARRSGEFSDSSEDEEEDSTSSDPSSMAEEETTPRARKRARQAQEPELKPWSIPSDGGRRFTNDDLSLLQSGTYSDAKIECLKHVWNVHRTILCTRSPWFAEAFKNNTEEGKEGHLALHEYEKEDIDTVLHFVYSGSLDSTKFNLENGSFVMFINLYNIGLTFRLPALQTDALTLLGQFCDVKLAALCSYDPATLGRNGVPSPAGDPTAYGTDLLEGIWRGYNEVPESNELQALLATFVFAGRARLFTLEGFQALSETCPMFGNDIFKVMLGTTISSYTPNFSPDGSPSSPSESNETMRNLSIGLDHTHRSQHPDRCTHCHEVFNDTRNQRGMYNPFALTVRPATYCVACVEAAGDAAPLWRRGSDLTE